MVVTLVPYLRRLVDLRYAHQLKDRHFLVTLLLAQVAMMGPRAFVIARNTWEPIWELDIAVAPQPCKQGRMGSVEVFIVAWAPERPDHALLALVWHVHLLGQAWANQQGFICKPFLPREAAFAFCWVAAVSAVG